VQFFVKDCAIFFFLNILTAVQLESKSVQR
jgi:hypothetical protein